MKQNNKKAVIYCRVATENQANGSSLAVQEKVCGVLAKTKGYKVSEVIVETASGANNNRDGFKKLLKLIKNKKVGAVCTYSIDRLTRNSQDGIGFLALLKKQGVELITANSPIGKFAETIIISYATYEREAHRQRILAGLARKKSLLRSGASSTI